MNERNIGSTFDSFLEEEGIKQEVEQRTASRDTSRDTAYVWFDPERGYVFRDTDEAPEGPYVPPEGRTDAEILGLDPVEEALSWLLHAIKCEMDQEDCGLIWTQIHPKAVEHYKKLQEELKAYRAPKPYWGGSGPDEYEVE